MGLLQALFGGSTQKSSSSSVSNSQQYQESLSNSESGNQAYYGLSRDLQGLIGQTYKNPDTSILESLLGYGDPSAGAKGFDNYKKQGGFSFLADRGAGGIVANRAASGLLNSGGSQKALAEFGTGLSNQFLTQYLSQLLGLAGFQSGEAQRGQDNSLKAADILRGAGQYSTAKSSSYGTGSSSSISQSKGTGMSTPGIIPGLTDLFKPSGGGG